MASIAHFLLPYIFSPTVFIITAVTLAAYIRGLCRQGIRGQYGRAIAFIIGVVLMYLVLQTHFDRWAQHMFFIHRAQHMILHHMGPFLVAISAPFATLRAGLPRVVRHHVLDPILANPVLQFIYRVVQQPFVAAFLFVGIIYFWLIPPIHFVGMLNVTAYNAMNWGMAIDGLLFWHVMLDPRPPMRGRVAGYGQRIGMLFAVIIPQVALGAYITFSTHNLYPVYVVCGRLWPISPIADQQIGGLITWIPSAMMSAIGMLVVLSQWMRRENPNGLPAHMVESGT